ncbi:MAG: hypothetical protein ACYCPK_03865 [Acidimicrobiales bacterium]
MGAINAPDFYQEPDGRYPVEEWLKKLPKVKQLAVKAAIRHVLQPRGMDLAKSEWLKPLGKGLHEFRIRHTEAEIRQMFTQEKVEAPQGDDGSGILLRIYIHFHGDRACLLLASHDKGDDPSERRQQREIKVARKRLEQWKQAERERKRALGKGKAGAAKTKTGRKASNHWAL